MIDQLAPYTGQVPLPSLLAAIDLDIGWATLFGAITFAGGIHRPCTNKHHAMVLGGV